MRIVLDAAAILQPLAEAAATFKREPEIAESPL
jgi:hypothetical protein